MAAYKTEQRKALLGFFNAHPDESFSAREIAEALADSGVSLSAIYRNLSAMTEEGQIRRSVSENGHEAMYQYIAAESCCGELHLTCTECGRTYHMSHEAASSVLESLSEQDGFQLDRSRTVLYGVCRGCSRGCGGHKA